MKIIIAADICVTHSNESLFANGNVLGLIGSELQAELSSADFRVFNLEGPITKSKKAISKCGPNIKMSPESVVGIKALNPSLLTLANNHIMDYGKDGYEDTISILKQNNIKYFGVGNNFQTLKKSQILEKYGIRIGFYACTEHEFSIATNDYPGANPYDPFTTFDEISNLKQFCDYVIVLYHGGKEFYRYTSPELQRCFRNMADKGADLVVAQHTHCIGCKEVYASATLVYGQGNFIFDHVNDEYWNTGIVISVELYKRDKIIKKAISYLPYQKLNGTIRLLMGEQKRLLLAKFNERSEEIKNPTLVKEKYTKFAESLYVSYLNALHGETFLFRIFRKIFGKEFVKKMYSNSAIINRIRNYVECESHREVLLECLKMHK